MECTLDQIVRIFKQVVKILLLEEWSTEIAEDVRKILLVIFESQVKTFLPQEKVAPKVVNLLESLTAEYVLHNIFPDSGEDAQVVKNRH